MGKEAKKEVKKVFQLLTTAQSNAYKEQVKKQGEALYVGSNSQLQNLLENEPDQNYLSIYKSKTGGVTTVHQLDELDDKEYHYDPKAKRDRHFHIKKEPETKDAYKYPLTSNQEYGWRQPIDYLEPKHNIRQTFDEKLMMSLKPKKPVIPKK